MNANEREWISKDNVYAIAQAAMEVSNESGPGFLETVCQEALEIELEERNILFATQLPIEIFQK